MEKTLKAKIIETDEKIRVIKDNRFWKDIKSGIIYLESEIKFIERSHDIGIGFHIWRIGLYLFGREYLKYKYWFIVPGLSVESVNGYDLYFDLEIKFLCIGFGVRLIWLKNWKLGQLIKSTKSDTINGPKDKLK